MPKKPLQDNVEREQHDLKSVARVKHRAGQCERIPIEARQAAVDHFTKGARILEDHGYGASYVSESVNGTDNGKRNGSHGRRA